MRAASISRLAALFAICSLCIADESHLASEQRERRVSATQESPSLTGRSSADQVPPADARSIAAAQAIRLALDADQELSAADITVTPGRNRVTVWGTVENDKQKNALMRKADRAGNRSNLDFNLTVKPR